MKHLPQRISLVSQAADILRQQMSSGNWQNHLPGERELCGRLHISRPTLRAALELLRREGRVEVSHGRRRKICKTKILRSKFAANRVGLLTPVPLHQMPPFVMCWVDALRERLADEGFDFDTHVMPATTPRHTENVLQRIVGDAHASVWLLFLSDEITQRWFAARSMPCVVTGSCFPEIDLPSVDVDYRAACRHAVGMFGAKGHKQIALLLPNNRAAGDDASEAGFLESVGLQNKTLRRLVIRHDATVHGIREKIDDLINKTDTVTALLVARSMHALAALTHLQRRGVKLPKEMALISRDNDGFLDFTTPRVTAYGCSPIAFSSRISRIVLQLAKGGSASSRPGLLMPELIPGETI